MSDKRDIVILEAGTDELRMSLVRAAGESIVVLDSCSFITKEKHDDRTSLQDQNLVDAASVAVSERNWVGTDAICLLGGGTVSCQFFDMPALSGPALRQAVTLKLGQQLHFPAAMAVVDIKVIPSSTAAKHNQIRAAVTAVRQEAAQAAIDATARLGLKITALTSSAATLSCLASARLEESDDLRAVLHFGERNSTLCVHRGKSPVVTSELPIGLDDFTKALMRPIISGDEVIQLDVQKAMELRDTVGIPEAELMIDSLGIPGGRLFPLLEPTLQKITQQLTQWLTFAATTEGGAKVTQLKITGLGSRMRGFSEALAARLRIKVEAWDWLSGITTMSDVAGEMSRDLFATVTSAAKHRRALPDLIPLEVKKSWRIRRVRRSTAIISPIVASGVLGFTFMFNQVRNYTQTTLGAQQALSNIQTVVDSNSKWEAEELRVSELRGMLDSFSLTTPSWEGLYKELSLLLPSELRATKYSVQSDNDGLHLRIDANIYTTPTGRDHDEVVEQTLLALDRSPFVAKVQLINSTRFPADGSHVESGSMSVNLALAYLVSRSTGEVAP